jgi:hypothetical protein
MENRVLKALIGLVDELEKQNHKLPRDNDGIWDRLYIAKDAIKKAENTTKPMQSSEKSFSELENENKQLKNLLKEHLRYLNAKVHLIENTVLKNDRGQINSHYAYNRGKVAGLCIAASECRDSLPNVSLQLLEELTS